LRLRLARATTAAVAAALLLALPACKSKSTESQEKSAAVPSAPPPTAPNPAAPDNAAAQAQAPAEPAPAQPVIVPAGTVLTVTLTDALGSKLSQPGQSFNGTLAKDVIVDGQTAIPSGAAVAGTVVNARPYGHLAGEATLVLKLTVVNVNNVDQTITTSSRGFGAKIKGSGVHKFFGGLAKRASGDEREVVLPAQSSYAFTLKQPLQIQ
jgi:hypothetical protein